MGNGRNILAFVIALALLVAGFRYGMSAMIGAPKQPAPPPEPAEWASWKEERFTELGFTVRHPADWPTIAGPDEASSVREMLAVDAREYLTVKVPKTLYKGTTFVDAFVTVSSGGDIPAADEQRKALCDLLVRRNGEISPLGRKQEIAGTAFSIGGTSTAALGTRTESLVFHAWFRGRCVELSENLLSSIGGRAKEFDRVDAWKRMDGIVRTFLPVDAAK